MHALRRPRRAAAIAVAVVASLALLAIAMTQGAQAAFPGPNGDIFFHTQGNGGDSIIARVNAKGKKFKKLTPEAIDATDVAVSPDGKRIAFECELENGGSEICVADRNGKRRRAVTNHPASDSDPAWSPDGKWIVFESDRDGDDEIYKVRATASACASSPRTTSATRTRAGRRRA